MKKLSQQLLKPVGGPFDRSFDRRHMASFCLMCLAMMAFPRNASAAELRLAAPFTNHMVLQREMAVPIWGTANPNSQITVAFAGQSKTTTAGSNGKWQVKLDPLAANSQPGQLIVQATQTEKRVALNDVLVGEVWLASGQSNMEWSMRATRDSAADIPNAKHPHVRLLRVQRNTSRTPLESANCSWQTCTPENVADFSSVAYYFGLKLHQDVKVPIGIIQSAWGGTRIEPWTSLSGFDAVPALKDLAAHIRVRTPGTPEYLAIHFKHLKDVETWAHAQRAALQNRKQALAMPAQPETLAGNEGSPTALYNAMIHPLVPMAIRGTIWYQGESNHNEGFFYVEKTKALLASWRSAFGQPNLPFYFVQIAPYHYNSEDPEVLPQFWIAQRDCMKIPNTGMAVITDIGNIQDIHPDKKKEVARRLALWALANEYQRKDIDPSGPMFDRYRVDNASIRVQFQHTSGGLKSRDGKPLTGFEIAGVDGLFQPAQAQIEGDSISLSSPKVPQPQKVRYCWSKIATSNLMNGSGLTACAFHSHWPTDPDLGVNFARGCSWKSSDVNLWGWNTGLTDGSWNSQAPQCFATGIAGSFPKHVTINLNEVRKLNLIRFGVPEFGSTKTISIEVSEDGAKFQQVGSHTFEQRKAQKTSVRFAETNSRYVRLTYQNNHAAEVGGFDKRFAFTTEVEAFHSK